MNRSKKDAKPLDVLLITPVLPLMGVHATGVRLFQIIRRLSEAGHRVRVTSIVSNEEEIDRQDELRAVVDKLFTFPLCDARGVGDPFHLLPENYRWPELTRHVSEEIERCDLVQMEYVQTGHLLPLNCFKGSLIVNHEVQTTTWFQRAALSPAISKDRFLNSYRALRALYMESTILKRFDVTIAMTQRDRRALERLSPGSRIEVLQIGVDIETYIPAEKAQYGQNILYVGYYRHVPNQDAARFLAAEIMPRVWAEFPDAQLTLAGSHPTPEIEALRSERIEVTGRVPDLLPYYQGADLFVAPIRQGRGVRGKMLEAFACGLPTVASELATAGTGARDKEHFLLAEGAEDFAMAIGRLFKYNEEMKKISANARRLAEGFGWDAIVEKNEGLMRDAVELAKQRLK